MENAIELKSDTPEITEVYINGESTVNSEEPAVTEAVGRTHISEQRAPKLPMIAAAVFGAAAGAYIALNKAVPSVLTERFREGFWSVFSVKFPINICCLAAEYFLGFFAFGDFVVWLVPLFLGLGAGLTLTAVRHAALLPSTASVILTGGLAAAFSSRFSAELREFSLGRSRRPSQAPAKDFTARFLVLSIAMLITAAYEGIIAEFVLK